MSGLVKNKFSIGGLKGVHFSRYTSGGTLQYLRLSGQFQVCFFFFFFFYKKILNAQKCKLSQNQLTKQKQANKKQQRQQFFVHKNF